MTLRSKHSGSGGGRAAGERKTHTWTRPAVEVRLVCTSYDSKPTSRRTLDLDEILGGAAAWAWRAERGEWRWWGEATPQELSTNRRGLQRESRVVCRTLPWHRHHQSERLSTPIMPAFVRAANTVVRREFRATLSAVHDWAESSACLHHFQELLCGNPKEASSWRYKMSGPPLRGEIVGSCMRARLGESGKA